ncbi:serine/threonine-protein kinase [Actinophytocola sp.]|uniref:serine/threonine-protein kinase n=1 Tax=Actinophytocola sp. TaxID=1872138 RepID=UPI002ED44DE2
MRNEDDQPTARPLGADDPTEIGDYQVHGVLGDGGMGRVYLCRRTGDGAFVAVKVVRPEYAGDLAFRRRFEQEVDTARRVQGQYTVPVLDADPRAEQPWLATSYIPGPSLAHAVERDGPQRQAAVLFLVAEVAEALRSIHAAGVVHRDLKPANVILSPDGPKVIDFGIARAVDVTSVTATGVLVGTPAYMAPEYLRGEPVSPAGDVFALGVLANYAATGRLAYGGGADAGVPYRIMERPPDLTGCPEPLRGIVSRCLEKDPRRRPTPDEVIRLCAAALPQAWSVPDGTAIVHPAGPVRRRVRSTRGALAAGGILLVVALIAAFVVWNPWGPDSPGASEGAGSGPTTTTSSTPEVPIQCEGVKQHLETSGPGIEYNIIGVYAEAYGKRCPGVNVSFDGTFPGPWTEFFAAGDLDFAGTNGPLSAEEVGPVTARCQGNAPWQLPMVFRPIVIMYRLDGVDDLTLNGEVTAKIFNGTITNWNDPAIKALNRSANLPDQAIEVFYRDKSEDNAPFQSWLRVSSNGAWTTDTGETYTGGIGTDVEHSSMKDEIGVRSGAIGYSTWREAFDHGIATARVDSGHGPVAVSMKSTANAIPADKIIGPGNDLVLNMEQVYAAPPPDTYPVLMVTYYIVCSKGYDPPTAAAIRAFLTAAATDGQPMLQGSGGVPISAGLKARLLQAAAAVS